MLLGRKTTTNKQYVVSYIGFFRFLFSILVELCLSLFISNNFQQRMTTRNIIFMYIVMSLAMFTGVFPIGRLTNHMTLSLYFTGELHSIPWFTVRIHPPVMKVGEADRIRQHAESHKQYTMPLSGCWGFTAQQHPLSYQNACTGVGCGDSSVG